MRDPEPYRWLHLSDLHVGCKGEALWWQMLDDFERSLDPWLKKLGAPDLILLTGDLAWSGTASDYERLDRFLERLLQRIETKTGHRPLLVPVPGNHDVQRPTGADLRPYRILDAYEPGADDDDVKALRQEIWEDRKPDFVAELFTHYSHWLDRTIIPQLTGKPGVTPHRSFFPGDLTVTLDLPDRFPLAIVGLNSAWSHYKGGDFTGKLLLPAEQFLAALPDPAPGGSPLDIFGQVERALLLMHHPRKWLTDKSRQIFDAQIHLGSRFTACLFGHMHEPDGVNVSQAGGAARSLYQAPSLFGLEHYGTKRESRIFGYTFGQLSRDGEVRLWPLRSVRRGDGVCTFDRDSFFHRSHDELDHVLIRRADPKPSPTRSGGRRPAPPLELDLNLNTYCREILDDTRYIRLDGIASAAKAVTYPIERLYTRLLTHAHEDGLRRELVDLAELLPKHHRLLIEGQPGSGKTTFLKLVASVLARDFLDEPCPDGSSWRAAHLSRDPPRTLPIYLENFSKLATTDTRKGAKRLLDHLAEATTPCTGESEKQARARREAWDQRLSRGEATILLDGLDEVGDPDLREQVMECLRDLLRTWPKCQVIIASRPISLEPLRALDFAHASVAPFGPDEIRAYVERWVHAYFENDPEKARGTTEQRYAEQLIATLQSRQELRRLASAPVMLTCLCVVYSHGGGLPEGRAELYRDTIRWLLAARASTRKDRGYGELRVQEALGMLALAMMGGQKGAKRRELGLKDAAEVIDPVIRGARFDLDPVARINAICEWLRFECEYSGVIEEIGRGQLQFKHLTFQEYLAAAQLASTPNRGWWPIIEARLMELQWRETIDLFPGCLLDATRGTTLDADHLVTQIHQLWPKELRLVRAARITAILSRFAPAFGCARYQPPKNSPNAAPRCSPRPKRSLSPKAQRRSRRSSGSPRPKRSASPAIVGSPPNVLRRTS
ncbi:MAG: NACHT domain-containing protein [Nannocystis sp.]|nr:NACHT domain-containing protein [Nannocystis sp.]